MDSDVRAVTVPGFLQQHLVPLPAGLVLWVAPGLLVECLDLGGAPRRTLHEGGEHPGIVRMCGDDCLELVGRHV